MTYEEIYEWFYEELIYCMEDLIFTMPATKENINKIETIEEFIQHCKKYTQRQLDEPRGNTGWTIRKTEFPKAGE